MVAFRIKGKYTITTVYWGSQYIDTFEKVLKMNGSGDLNKSHIS
jgi:hypothetical protein